MKTSEVSSFLPLPNNSVTIRLNFLLDLIRFSKYNPLAGCSYIKLPKELDHPRKRLNSIQNIANNECFKWCLVRYLNPAKLPPSKNYKT